MAARILVVSLLFAATLRAASPQIGMISPLGGQRGSEVELTITGQHLGDVKGLLFYAPGFEVTEIKAIDDKTAKAKVKIAPDCELGPREFRLWTATGLSEVRLFSAGPFPNIDEKEPNNDPAHAQPVPLNITVNGTITDEDIDYFSVEAKKGQRLTAEVEGMRLGWTMFDPWLAIMNKDGRELIANDDNALFLQDPLASIIVPEDGTYLIAVRDSAWGGSDQCRYRLHIGTFAQPVAVYPPGGQTGEETVFTLLGDTAGLAEKKLKLPSAPQDRFTVVADQDGVSAPAGNLIRASSFPSVAQVAPKDDRDHATATDKPLPLAFNGVISEKGAAGFFRFKAKKDEQYDVNVYARRLRSPLDSVLTIYDSQGKGIAGNDDAAGLDSYLRFKVPADGDYYLSVRDQQRRGGPTFTYRVEVTPVHPGVSVEIPQIVKDSQERQTIVIPRANRYATLIRNKRADYAGGFKIEAPDLPRGTYVNMGPMAGDVMPVVFEAAPDAPVAASLCAINVRADDAGKAPLGHYDQGVDLCISNPNNTVYLRTSVDKLAVAVADEAPFKIDIVQPKVPILQNGELALKVVATRKPGFDAPINISMLYNPPGIGSQSTVTIDKGKSEATIPLSAGGDAKVRAWKIAVIGSGDAGNGATWVSSQLADLQVAAPFVVAQIGRAYTEQGQPVTVSCKLTQSVPFTGKAKLQLLGLPNKASAPELEITSADQEAHFNVTTDISTPAGQDRSLFCHITFERDGEKIVENTGQGGVLRVDKVVGKAEVARQ